MGSSYGTLPHDLGNPVVSVKLDAMLDAARELLIDLERHELTLDDQQAAEPLPSSGSPIEAAVAASSSHSSSDVQRASEHRELLLGQLDRLKESVAQEQTSNRMLRSEKSKLSGDMRTLAQQLKQERAASNAVLAVRMGTEPPTDGSGAAKAEAAHGEHGTGDRGTGGLTLASAASQILMLRREVKWLQKQWQSARRDQDGSANRDQLDSLQQALEETPDLEPAPTGFSHLLVACQCGPRSAVRVGVYPATTFAGLVRRKPHTPHAASHAALATSHTPHATRHCPPRVVRPCLRPRQVRHGSVQSPHAESVCKATHKLLEALQLLEQKTAGRAGGSNT